MRNAMQLKAIVKNMAREKKIPAVLVLQNYMLERFFWKGCPFQDTVEIALSSEAF